MTRPSRQCATGTHFFGLRSIEGSYGRPLKSQPGFWIGGRLLKPTVVSWHEPGQTKTNKHLKMPCWAARLMSHLWGIGRTSRRTGFRLMEPLNTNLTINHQSSLRETRLMRCSRAEFIISFLELPCHCNITNSSLLNQSIPREALLYWPFDLRWTHNFYNVCRLNGNWRRSDMCRPDHIQPVRW